MTPSAWQHSRLTWEVRTPALYHYFAGLAGLRRALVLLGLQEVEARVGRAVMGKAGDDAVLALAHALRDFANERPGLYEAASRAPDPEDQEWQRCKNRTRTQVSPTSIHPIVFWIY